MKVGNVTVRHLPGSKRYECEEIPGVLGLHDRGSLDISFMGAPREKRNVLGTEQEIATFFVHRVRALKIRGLEGFDWGFKAKRESFFKKMLQESQPITKELLDSGGSVTVRNGQDPWEAFREQEGRWIPVDGSVRVGGVAISGVASTWTAGLLGEQHAAEAFERAILELPRVEHRRRVEGEFRDDPGDPIHLSGTVREDLGSYPSHWTQEQINSHRESWNLAFGVPPEINDWTPEQMPF